jgi:signal transduction histidine kinase
MPKIMRVVLNRSNDLLEQLIRDILFDIFGDSAILTVSQYSAPESADVVIWNYQSGDNPPVYGNEASSKPLILFLASEPELRELKLAIGERVTNFILKPVQRDNVEAFLRAVSSTYMKEGRPSVSAIESMRDQRDDLLLALMQANVRLQEYGRDRTNFLTRAVHDFQAPLSALTGYCGLLMSGQLGPVSAQQREVLVRMRQSAIHLSELTEGMLDLSTGLQTDREPALRETDLRQCVQQALDKARPLIDEKSIDVSVDLAPPAGPLLVDPSKLEQVCSTLVYNACRFSPRGGYLEVTGYSFRADCGGDPVASFGQRREAESPNCYRVDFRDAGPEIKSPSLADIFEEHISSLPGHARADAGLGLARCRMVIAQHGGHIWADNSESGAVFSFALPFATAKGLDAGSLVAHA